MPGFWGLGCDRQPRLFVQPRRRVKVHRHTTNSGVTCSLAGIHVTNWRWCRGCGGWRQHRPGYMYLCIWIDIHYPTLVSGLWSKITPLQFSGALSLWIGLAWRQPPHLRRNYLHNSRCKHPIEAYNYNQTAFAPPYIPKELTKALSYKLISL